jgi:hypothetical protein
MHGIVKPGAQVLRSPQSSARRAGPSELFPSTAEPRVAARWQPCAQSVGEPEGRVAVRSQSGGHPHPRTPSITSRDRGGVTPTLRSG